MLPGRNQPTTAATDHVRQTDVEALFGFCTGGKRTDPSSQFSVFYILHSFPRLLSSHFSPSRKQRGCPKKKKKKNFSKVYSCAPLIAAPPKRNWDILQYGASRSISGSQLGGWRSVRRDQSLCSNRNKTSSWITRGFSELITAEYLKLHISSDCFVLFQVILKVKYELHFSCSLTCFLPICMNLRKPVKVMFIFYYYAISDICLTHICEDTPEGSEVKVKFNVRRRWEWSQVYDDVFKVTFEGDADITGMW